MTGGDVRERIKAKREAAFDVMKKANDDKEVVNKLLESDYTSLGAEEKEWNNLSDIKNLSYWSVDPKLISKHVESIQESVKTAQNLVDAAQRISLLGIVAAKCTSKSAENQLFSPEFIFLVSIVMTENTSLQHSFSVRFFNQVHGVFGC